MTANFGELIPITSIETVPGDYITMRVSDLLRALPMVTSPFMRVKQHIDVWFCPYDYLWHNFEAFLTMKDNPVSSMTKGFSYVPHTTKDKLAHIVLDSTYNNYKDVVSRNYQSGARKLLDYLGYGRPVIHSVTDPDTSKSVNIWRLATYNKIWYDEYRQKYYDDGKRLITTSTNNAAELFNFDDLVCSSVANSEVSIQRLLPMAQLRYRLWKKDLFTGILPATQFGAVAAVPFNGSVPVNITGTASLSGSTGSDRNSHSLTYWNGSSEVPFNNVNDLDSLTPFPFSGVVGVSRSASQIAPDGSITWGNGLRVDNGSNHLLVNSNAILDTHTHSLNGTASVSASGSAGLTGNAFDILALRHQQAVQIWRENSLRAGNRISDNMRAHYGEDAEYDDHRCQFLGSVDAPLNIGDIDAHAQTGSQHGQQLADVAGKGLSSLNQKVFKYKAKKFGTIMVMFSLLPEAEYESQGVDGMNTLLEREDYFQREFQNTGLKAVAVDNFYYLGANVDPLGYAPAYIDYKQKLDKCFESFWSNNPFSPWASPKTDVSQVFNAITSTVVLPLSLLYINPALYDRNFGVAVTGESGAEATSEQVICDFYFDVNAVRPMSVVGLPQNI